MAELARWASFYDIVGAAAGALIGLQFVVMTLIANRPPARGAAAGAAFATPTIVHFSVVLFLAALLRAPWDSITAAALICGVTGLGGVAYALVTGWRMRTQTAYKADSEDWLFHAALPFAAYITLAISAFAALSYTHAAMFGMAGAMLALLFTAIHNAWDATAYHVLVSSQRQGGE